MQLAFSVVDLTLHSGIGLQEKKALSNQAAPSGLGPASTTRLGLGGVPITQPKVSRPAPLRVDDQGREIDAQGNIIQKPKDPLSTLKVSCFRYEGGRVWVVVAQARLKMPCVHISHQLMPESQSEEEAGCCQGLQLLHLRFDKCLTWLRSAKPISRKHTRF